MHDADFVGHLRAAQDSHKRPVRMRNRFTEIGELFLHQQPRRGLADELGDADDGGVGAMRRAECVANEKLVAERRQLFRKLGIVLFFLGMVADVFEQQDVPVAQGLALLFRRGSYAIRRKFHRLAEQFAQPRSHWCEAVLRVGLCPWGGRDARPG